MKKTPELFDKWNEKKKDIEFNKYIGDGSES